jgi:NAD+ kinase
MIGANPVSEQRDTVVGVVAKNSNPEAQKLLLSLIHWLEKNDLNFRIEQSSARNLRAYANKVSLHISREKLTSECDPIVVLGGDGTLISVCRHPTDKIPTIIGVNLGTLGFLTEITVGEIIPTLSKVLQKKLPTEERPLLIAEIYRTGEEPVTAHAINDIVLSKEALARIFPVKFSVSGQFAAVIKGDGIVVSTPTGSTAYSLAAGGSIVHPEVNAILVTPICSHSLTSRPLVLPGDRVVELDIGGKREEKSVYITVDGQEGFPLHAGDRVKVTISDKRVLFAKSETRTYYDVLGTKLKWAMQ